MSALQILVIKLMANYSSGCNFKIKIEHSTSKFKEFTENKHSFKYIKGSAEVNINETLELILNETLTTDSKLQFFLEVYTKSGYKTAGVGILSISDEISNYSPIKIEIKKCPLGKGYLEIQFKNLKQTKELENS